MGDKVKNSSKEIIILDNDDESGLCSQATSSSNAA